MTILSQESKLVLNVLCMNPAVIFSPIEKSVRSIILSSGTLTPTLSFAAELGAEFPIVLQTGHVISSNQVRNETACKHHRLTYYVIGLS